MLNIIFDKELSYKHKIISILSFQNLKIASVLLNFYVGIKSRFNSEYDKKFKISYLTKNSFSVQIDEGEFFTATPYRALNLSRGLEWRINLLAHSYGINWFKNIFKKKINVIDLGANIGEFSIFVAKKGANVFAIEHDKAVFKMLALNAKKYSQIKAFNYSISNISGKQDIYYGTISGSSTIIKPHNTSKFKEFSIDNFKADDKAVGVSEGITLDDFIDKNNIKKVDLIKCDAEGAEPEMLQGLNKHINKVGYFTIDTGPERNGEETTKEVIEILQSKNFEILKSPDASFGRVVIARNKSYVI